MSEQLSLPQLGWQPFFQQQISLEEFESCTMARVIGQQRSLIALLTTQGRRSLPLSPSVAELVVGDWILLDAENRFTRLLERLSLFSRKAAGAKVATQLIAANINTLFIVSSMNQDFNLNRLERYLSLANDAGVDPVILLTKADLCEDRQAYIEQAQLLGPTQEILILNSLQPENVRQLTAWCSTGKTIAFLGSSGVGKSTLINTLLGDTLQQTQAIREDDAKGRHTTTSRSLHPLATGGLLLDTPGMRELQLAACEHGVEETFAEIALLASHCRFADCQHQSEPGCAVRAAIEAGTLHERRLNNYLKLMREQAFNSATLAEKRANDRKFARHVRTVVNSKRKEKNG
ncbi:MAG: ribosome small subunit-dependent GTPase A [Gammaproteobacteria bacterium]|nr:ribosome small subunit-dependent GTPase A [Gammaproteobacteria bacterium]